MLEVNRLCVDPGDGSPALEYRVQDDRVECRTLEPAPEKNRMIEKPWKAMSSDELSSHVMADTFLAHWLKLRMGYRRLLRACNRDSILNNEIPDRSRQRVA